MNILIVDDQPNVLASLINSIEWEEIGIQNVFVASSALSGKQILLQKDVHILMTDIEMPAENGLSLIKWAREKHLPLEAILLTSHASFYYAKEAISLGVIDYVMQPARNEEIVKAILNAKERIEKKRNLEEKLKIGTFSAHEQNLAARRFLERWPDPSAPDFSQRLEHNIRRLEDLGLPCQADSTALLFLTQVNRWFTIPEPPLELLAKYQQLIKETFSFLNTASTSFSLSDSEFITLCFPSSTEDLALYFQNLADSVYQKMQCSVSLYYLTVRLEELKTGMTLLTGLEERADPSHAPVIEKKQLFEQVLNPQASLSYQKYFVQIERYITQKIQEPITRTELADYLHLSPDYISHIVRVMKGCSCKEWITRRKMNYARQLIQTTALPIGEIAARCGYDSFAYFSKVYKLYFNATPREDRNDKGKTE